MATEQPEQFYRISQLSNSLAKMKISILTSTSKLSEHSPTRCRGSDSKGGSHYFWVTKCSDSSSSKSKSSSKSRRPSTSSMDVELGAYISSPRCEIGHCNRRQTASVDSSGRLVQGPYCSDHACKLGPAVCRKPKNRDDQYCKEREYQVQDKDYGYSYTSVHDRWESYYANADYTRYSNSETWRQQKLTYVPVDATCAMAHCLMRAYGLSDKSLPWYCPDHTCTKPGCDAVRFSGRHCARHFYPDPAPVPARDAGRRYCSEEGCRDAAVGWTGLCAWHKCKEKDCYSPRRIGGLYCKRHFGYLMMDYDPGHY